MKFNHKHQILLLLCLLLTSCSNARASWFGWDEANWERQRADEQRRKLSEAEHQITEHRQAVHKWELAAGSLAVGAVLLLIIGTALGTRTRHAARTQP